MEAFKFSARMSRVTAGFTRTAAGWRICSLATASQFEFFPQMAFAEAGV